jgi:protein O-mannosyl-transferase
VIITGVPKGRLLVPRRSPRFPSARWAALLALAALTVFVYEPVRHHDFVSIDDPVYVTENPVVSRGLTLNGLAWAFTTGHASNWHPLTWLSHMLDVQLFGTNAAAHHGTSLVLHLLDSLALYLLLHRATGRSGPSWVVAALFAVHPLHVESVAWVAERKDVLSTLFWFLTTWAYVGYCQAEEPSAGAGIGRQRTSLSLLVLLLFALGLMAKPMLVTLPLTLLLLDVWPLGRAGWPQFDAASWRAWRRLVLEKVPLLALAAASSVVTFMVQQSGGAVSALATIPLGRRLANALVSYGAYAARAIWPSGLSPFYPYPADIPPVEVAAAAALIVGVTGLAVRFARTRPYLLVGWLWYLITLLPVIGLVQIGRQATADRYTYVPLIGLFVAAAWGAADVMATSRTRRVALAATAVATVAALAVVARAQVHVWADSTTLWRHALALDARNYYAHHALGCLSSDAGRTDEAVRSFEETIRLAPDYPEGHYNLGLMRMRQGRFDDAIRSYRAALQLDPRLADAHNGLAAALAAEHRFADAIREHREAIRLRPDSARYHQALGRTLLSAGDVDRAVAGLREAARLQPDLAAARSDLGKALAGRGELDEAIASYRDALALDPRLVDAHNNLGVALMARGNATEAADHYRRALAVRPDQAEVHSNLAVALAALGDRDGSIAEFGRALALQTGLAAAHTGLALALSTSGRLAEALPHFAEAARLQPNSDAAHQYYGLALAGAGRMDEAVIELTEALRLNPGNTTARQALMLAQTRTRR